jgi:drug/metabolite transporter (DMT)-like permease
VIGLALLKRPAAPTPAGRHGLATLFAILTGITIAAYIVVDGLGVRGAGPTPQHWLAYIVWLYVLEGPWMFLLAMCLRPDTLWPHLRAHWWRGAVGGVIGSVSYGIAVFALALAPMAHVAALRETTVLFGALIGVVLLHEPFGTQRVLAAVVIVVGLVLLNGPTLF